MLHEVDRTHYTSSKKIFTIIPSKLWSNSLNHTLDKSDILMEEIPKDYNQCLVNATLHECG